MKTDSHNLRPMEERENFLADWLNHDSESARAWTNARRLAGHSREIRLPHVAIALLHEPSIRARLPRAEQARRALETWLRESPATDEQSVLDPWQLETAVTAAGGRLGAAGLLRECLNGVFRDVYSHQVKQLLNTFGVNEAALASDARKTGHDAVPYLVYDGLGFGLDLTAMARAKFWASAPAPGTEKLIKQIATACLTKMESILILGKPGVGKSHLVYQLAWLIATQDPSIPSELWDYTVVELGQKDLVRGTGEQGSLEERMNKLIQFAAAHPEVVFFFDEVYSLFGQENTVSATISAALKPELEWGVISCICAVTEQEHAQSVAKDPAMNTRLTKLWRNEPKGDELVRSLFASRANLVGRIGLDRGIGINDEAIREAVSLTDLYLQETAQPRSACKALRKAVSIKYYDLKMGDTENEQVTPEDVRVALGQMLGVPAEHLSGGAEEFYGRMGERLAEAFPAAGEAMARLFRRLAGAANAQTDPSKPMGCFLLTGSTAPRLARVIAHELTTVGAGIVELDLASLPPNEGAVNTMRGSPQGYVDSGGPCLYSAFESRSFATVLLENVDACPAAALNVLSKMFSGRDFDSHGRSKDFRQCVFIATAAQMPDADESHGTPIWLRRLVGRFDQILVLNGHDSADLRRAFRDLIARRRAVARVPLPEALEDAQVLDHLVEEAERRPNTPLDRILDEHLF